MGGRTGSGWRTGLGFLAGFLAIEMASRFSFHRGCDEFLRPVRLGGLVGWERLRNDMNEEFRDKPRTVELFLTRSKSLQAVLTLS